MTVRLFLTGKFLPNYVEAVFALRRLPPKAAVSACSRHSFVEGIKPARNGTKADTMLHAACRNAALRLASESGNSFSVVCFVIRAEVQDSVPIRNGYFVFTGQPADSTRQFERIQARMSQKFFPRKRIVMQCTPYNTCIFSNRTFIHKLCYQKDPTLQCTMR